LEEDGIEYKGYEKISLDKILQISGDSGGELKFMFARQIAPSNIETMLSLLYIKKIIDEYSDKVKEVILDSLQWKDDNFSFRNDEKKIYVIPQMLYSESKYPIAAVKSKDGLEEYSESMRKLKEYGGRIGDIYLDVNKIIEMIKRTGLEYMGESLKYLEDKGKVTKIKIKTEKGEAIKDAVNILDFWGLATLYYIVEVSKHIFGIDKYEIETFNDRIKLVNGDEFDISGYELTFKYKEKELKFRVYDASHIYEKENEKYKKEEKMNSYITLSLYSGSGYILFEVDPEKLDEKIRDFYRKAREATGYDISLLVVDEEELIKRLLKEDGEKLIGKDNYLELISSKDKIEYINTIYSIGVRFIGKDKIEKFIDTMSKIYGI
jgi:hypothetical protein